MRKVFIEELCAAAVERDNIALIVGDLGYGVVEPFAQRFPERFFNAGVAEQNMMGLAAGLASEGLHVFVYSIANFPTFRCAEQIRNDVAYHRLAVTVVAIGAGLAYGNLGYSHHAVQDYALMRVLPHTLIAAPGDALEVRACVRYLLQHPQPSYLRLGKDEPACVHQSVPSVAPGLWLPVLAPANARQACLSTGTTLQLAHQTLACNPHLADQTALFTLPLWSMHCKTMQAAQAQGFERVLTLEDHLPDGGFGSWLLEALAASGTQRCAIDLMALDARVCASVGQQSTLNALGGLSAQALSERLQRWPDPPPNLGPAPKQPSSA